MLTLRQLRYLDALARHRHFGRAAEACAVSQPALSMQIRELERDLGLELVERNAGDIRLTNAGTAIAARAEKILVAARDLVDFARHQGRLLCGQLRLGIIPTVAPYLLPRILPVVQQRHPELLLELRETQTGPLLGELIRGSIDAAIVALPVVDADVETAFLFDDAFLLAAPIGDPLPKRNLLARKDIDPQRLILLEEGHCLRDQALAFCGTQNSGRMKELGATSLTTVMQMVANGYGVTLIPEIAVAIEGRDPRVQIRRFGGREPKRTIGLAWRRRSAREADYRALARLIAETIAPGKPAETQHR